MRREPINQPRQLPYTIFDFKHLVDDRMDGFVQHERLHQTALGVPLLIQYAAERRRRPSELPSRQKACNTRYPSLELEVADITGVKHPRELEWVVRSAGEPKLASGGRSDA